MIEDFDCKIYGLAFGAALWHSLGLSDTQAETQAVTAQFQVCGSHFWLQLASSLWL